LGEKNRKNTLECRDPESTIGIRKSAGPEGKKKNGEDARKQQRKGKGISPVSNGNSKNLKKKMGALSRPKGKTTRDGLRGAI